MPEHPTPLINGLHISQAAWERERTDEHLRCGRCKTVYPGRHMAQVGADGVCKECREQEAPIHDDVDAYKRARDGDES